MYVSGLIAVLKNCEGEALEMEKEFSWDYPSVGLRVKVGAETADVDTGKSGSQDEHYSTLLN